MEHLLSLLIYWLCLWLVFEKVLGKASLTAEHVSKGVLEQQPGKVLLLQHCSGSSHFTFLQKGRNSRDKCSCSYEK